MSEEEVFFDKFPHGNEKQAVYGYTYVGEAEEVLSFWDELVKNSLEENDSDLHVGTNFDLSKDVDNIDHCRKLEISYDFMHRVMLYYYEPDEESKSKQMSLKEFKTYIGV